MTRPSVIMLCLLLGGTLPSAGCGHSGGSISTDPPLAVLGPEAVILRTPDSFGHTAFEMSVAFSLDGRTVAAGRMESSGAVVSLCDVTSGRERVTIKASAVESCAVAFSPNGRTLAVSKSHGVSLHDPETGHERVELTAEYAFDPLGLAFSSDGQRLAAATGMGNVIVWDIGTGRCLGSFKAHTRSLQGVALSPDGQLVASASDGPIVCHSYGPFGLPSQLFGVAAFGCGPDCGIVRLFDVATGREKASLKHAWTVHSVAFSPDGKRLASGGGGAARLWDLAKNQTRTINEAGDGLDVYCVAFSPDARTLAVAVGSREFGGTYGEVRLLDVELGKVRAVLKGEAGKVRSLAFAPDGGSLVTGSSRAVVLWEVPPDQDRNAGPKDASPSRSRPTIEASAVTR